MLRTQWPVCSVGAPGTMWVQALLSHRGRCRQARTQRAGLQVASAPESGLLALGLSLLHLHNGAGGVYLAGRWLGFGEAASVRRKLEKDHGGRGSHL